jgi:hypothetical protein
MNVFEAGDLIDKAYKNKLGNKVKHTLDVDGVQAYYLHDGTLVIPGTNEKSDWKKYNLKIKAVKADEGRYFHKGFLTHSQVVTMFAKPLKPKFIVGHSLGAASAQIVGARLKTPTIAFASPKVLSGTRYFKGEGWVANYLRKDDTVCYMPPNIKRKNYRHMGSIYWMGPKSFNLGEDHTLTNYMEILRDERYKTMVPQDWPRS